MYRVIVLAIAMAGFPALHAHASSSEWFETEGARVRLVATGMPDAAGNVSGALDIALKPGWKTYWRDPGDAGVPPFIDIRSSTNIGAATLDFPAPQRHDEGDFMWAGYDYPVALPVTLTLKSPGEIEARVFLGICETICVPLQATLVLDPSSDPDNADDATIVSMARAALPEAATDDFGVRVVSSPGARTIVVEASFPGDPATAELFVAGEEGYTFSTPKRGESGGRTVFSMDVEMPARIGTGKGLPYTLVTDAGAVSGYLPYF